MSSAATPTTGNEPLAALMASQDPMRWQLLMTTLALANTESQALMTEVMTGSGPLATVTKGDPMGATDAFRNVGMSLAMNPAALMQANFELMQGWMNLWQEMVTETLSQEPPKEKDKRFSDPEWQTNPAFKFIRKAYDVNSRWMNSLADRATGMDPAVQLRARFFMQMLTESLSPTNFLGTNPQALRTFIESGGESVLAGLRMARDDVRKGGGKLYITQTDETPFEVGVNVATAPGEVVFRNDLIELIQYAPTQAQAYSKPLVIFPPWINKFYVLDLREENSMIRWLVDRGLTVFVVSWRSADKVTMNYDWDDYVKKGIYAAVEGALQAADAKQVNCVGYCIGGTLLTSALAHMSITGYDKIASATFFASQSDFELAGDLKVFTDGPGRDYVYGLIDEHGGIMPGKDMYETFNWLRPIDLVWRYVVDTYMLGKPPRPFDLLYWNADQTNIPGPVHRRYLKECYSENRLAKGEYTVLGQKVNMGDIKIPVMLQASKDDHIVPYESVFRTAKLYGGDATFVLSGSGHIAGVVNHPDSKKYQHWVNPGKLGATANEWLTTSTEIPGSWWPTWWDWLRPKSGRKVAAPQPKDMGLGAAPGTYARVRLADIPLPPR
jgi:polyhydroxyalkanoate synthase